MRTFTVFLLFIIFCSVSNVSISSDSAALKVLMETLNVLNMDRIPESGLFRTALSLDNMVNPDGVSISAVGIVTDIEFNSLDSSLFIVRSDSLYLLKNNVFQLIPVDDKIYDISVSPNGLYVACKSHIYKFGLPLVKNSVPSQLLYWSWDPTVSISAKPKGSTGDFVTYYIANWGSLSGVNLLYPNKITKRLTWGGAGYGLFDTEKDFLYFFDQVSKRYNLSDSSSITISNYVSSSFLLNGKSFLLSAIDKFSTDYGLTWKNTQKPFEVLNLIPTTAVIRLNENKLAWADDRSDKLMLLDADGKIYPTTVRVPDRFQLKTVIKNIIWGIAAGDLVSVDISGYKIENYVTVSPLQQTLTILSYGDKPEQKLTCQSRYGKVLFKSNDESIAVVNAQGVVTAKRTGLVTIVSYVPARGDTAYAENKSVIYVNSTKSQEVRICAGSAYNGWTSQGSYVQNFIVSGADSTVYTTLFVDPLPSKPGNISGASTITRGNSVQFWVAPVQNTNSYAWELPSGATGSSSTNNILVTFSETARSGAISVKAFNSCGASPASVYPILISSAEINHIQAQLKIYPNPVDERLFVDLSFNSKPGQLEIIDRLGKTIHKESFTLDKLQINTGSFPPGYYILRISGNEGIRSTGFIKN